MKTEKKYSKNNLFVIATCLILMICMIAGCDGSSGSSGSTGAENETPGVGGLTNDSSDLVLHWEFNETQGEVIEDSSGHNNSPLIETGYYGDSGRGQVLYLDEGHKEISLNKGPDGFEHFNTYTVSFWYKPDILNYPRLGTTIEELEIKFSVNGVFMGGAGVKFESNDLVSWGILQTGEWQHIAFSYDFGYSRYYLNGHLIGYKTAQPANSWSDFKLKNINGQLDDVRVYNRVLSSQEIRRFSQAVASKGVLYWNFENPGAMIEDVSGNGNDAEAKDLEWDSDEERGNVGLLYAGHRDISSTLYGMDYASGFSVNFWILPKRFFRDGTAYSNIIGPGTDSFIFRTNESGGIQAGTNADDKFNANELDEEADLDMWQMFTFVYDAGGMGRLFKNAVLIGEKQMTPPQSLNGFRLRNLEAKIDDIQVFSSPLEDKDINALYSGQDLPESDKPHDIFEERYDSELIWQTHVIPGEDSPGDGALPGWNILSEFGTITAFEDNYYMLRLEDARPVVVKITKNDQGEYVGEEAFLDNDEEDVYRVLADSHHHFAMETDKEGNLHIVGDMHNYPVTSPPMEHLPQRYKDRYILYWRTTRPGDLDSLTFMGDDEEHAPRGTGFTYLSFFKNAQGDLFMSGRYDILPGWFAGETYPGRNKKGVGVTRYDPDSQEWLVIGEKPEPAEQARAEVVFYEEFAEALADNGYSKVQPCISFDTSDNLHIAAPLLDNDQGVNYVDVAKENGGDTIIHYTSDIAYLLSKDGGFTYEKSDGTSPLLPAGVLPGPSQAEILYSSGFDNEVLSVNASIALDYKDQPVVTFRRQMLIPSDEIRQRTMWRKGENWELVERIGSYAMLDESIRNLIGGYDGVLTLLPVRGLTRIWRFWESDGEVRQVNLDFIPKYVSRNHYMLTGELLFLAYDSDSEIMSFYKVSIER